MNLSAPFVRRPVATTLLTIGATLVGIVAFQFLPVASLPQVEFPTINVSASLPGASPETMASSVAAPLERQFTRIAGVTEMTSSSTIGGTNVTLQFELNRISTVPRGTCRRRSTRLVPICRRICRPFHDTAR
jgi:multidrug efflux pump